MISRRKLLKLAGLGSVAFATGFTIGNLTTAPSNPKHFIVHGFIPNDDKIIEDIIVHFRKMIKCDGSLIISAGKRESEIIKRFHNNYYAGAENIKGKFFYRIKKLEEQINADIVVSDNSKSIYSIDDMNFSFYEIRKNIFNQKAELMFTAEYKEEEPFWSLINSKKKEIIIENEKGLFDIIPLEKNYSNITINGPLGKTSLRIENGLAHIHSSSCRNGICKHWIACEVGDIIACAPNKILVKVI